MILVTKLMHSNPSIQLSKKGTPESKVVYTYIIQYIISLGFFELFFYFFKFFQATSVTRFD